jgi:hypothetical protein
MPDSLGPRYHAPLRQLVGYDPDNPYEPNKGNGNPLLKYDMSGALDPKNDSFASLDGHQLFYAVKPKKDVILPNRLKGPLSDIGEEFFYQTGKPIMITSGFREPPEQARLMFDLLNKGSNVYRGPSGQEVTRIFLDGRRSGASYDDVVASMGDTIRRQMANGGFVSEHLRRNAADFRDPGTPGQRALLESIARRHGHSPLFHDKHLHVNFHLR